MTSPDQEFPQLLARLMQSIDELQARIDQKKRLVNELCIEYEQPPRFGDVDAALRSSAGTIRRDQFYGRPMATAMREFLELRGASDRGGQGAASVNEIYAALIQGGFKFDTKNDLNAKRGLRDALSKNTSTFHRIGDAYGLVEWYPKPPRPERPAKKIRSSSKKAKRTKVAQEPNATEADNVVDLKSEAEKAA